MIKPVCLLLLPLITVLSACAGPQLRQQPQRVCVGVGGGPDCTVTIAIDDDLVSKLVARVGERDWILWAQALQGSDAWFPSDGYPSFTACEAASTSRFAAADRKGAKLRFVYSCFPSAFDPRGK